MPPRTKTSKPKESPLASTGNTLPPKPKNVSQLLQRLPTLFVQAMATKMYEVEEPVDYYVHRPLAAVLTLGVYFAPFVITPNQITLSGLGLGWIAAWFLYEATFPTLFVPTYLTETHAWYLASLFFFMWIVSDCSDGQVARLLKRGTRLGRVIDGTVDVLVLVPNCVVLFLLTYKRFGWEWGWAAGFAGISLGTHAGLYDQVKNTYMEQSLPLTETSGESSDTVHAEYIAAKKRDGCTLNTILLGWYFVYLTRQELMFGGKAPSRETVDQKSDQAKRDKYRLQYAWTMRLASLLGISAHITPMYLTWLLAPSFPNVVKALVILFAGPMNILHLWVTLQYNCTKMKKGL